MNAPALKPDTETIEVDEIFPHAPETIWKTLTDGALMARWLGMTPNGFEPVKGKQFTYQTTPGGAWDGIIRCEVLEAIPNQQLVYTWKSGHAENIGYGAPLDSVVTFTLAKTENGTRLRAVHSGFVLPRNEAAFKNMGEGWKKVVPRIGAMAGEQD
jgi:uncharacterized protein YndB with AHSA1/START domain